MPQNLCFTSPLLLEPLFPKLKCSLDLGDREKGEVGRGGGRRGGGKELGAGERKG